MGLKALTLTFLESQRSGLSFVVNTNSIYEYFMMTVTGHVSGTHMSLQSTKG